MSDTASTEELQGTAARNAATLRDALVPSSDAMVLAGLDAALAATTYLDAKGRRQFKPGTTSRDEYAAIWQAMLAQKLRELAG